MLDFEKQMGFDEAALEGKIVMPGGDGASYTAVYLDVDDLTNHFQKLKTSNKLPTLEEIHATARILVCWYATQEAYSQALSSEESENATEAMKIPKGKPWTVPKLAEDTQLSSTTSENIDQPHRGTGEEESIVEDENMEAESSRGAQPQLEPETEEHELLKEEKEKKKTHVKAKGFTGDRVLANTILFLQDAGWWVEASYAIPEGNIGCVYEILKIWIFQFSGKTNHNYANWLLEMYCLVRYESSKDLSNGILNNWLVNIIGELGKWIEGDLLQEHYNWWLEDMAEKM
ncbi:hypothetical protein DXG01_012393, partial [Tephrocybe rancida]